MARTLIATIDGKAVPVPAETARKLDIRPAGGGEGGGNRGRTMLFDVHAGTRVIRVGVRQLPDGETEIWVGRYRVAVWIQDEREARLGEFVREGTGTATALRVKAPMPGLIKEIAVSKGDSVVRGQRLLTLEAMKMENEITAPGEGIVDAFDLAPGVSVEKGQVLIQLKKHDH